MRRIYTLIFLVFGVSNGLIAQDLHNNKIHKFKAGINAGPNFSSLRGDEFAEKYDSNFNFFVGISLEYKINETFSILTNVNYEEKSFKSEYITTIGFFTNFETAEIEDTTKFRYLNIPVLLRVYFGFENEFFVNAGIFYNSLLDVNNKMINKGNGEDISVIDFNDLFEDDDLGISFGIGMNFELNDKQTLSIELRDDFGISDTAKFDYSSISETNTNTIKLIANWSLGF